MTCNLLDLQHSIARYPSLLEALGPRWVRDQVDIDPVDSRYMLARWLRIPEAEHVLEHINAMLARLSAFPGIAERRSKLKSNPESFLETVTELRVATWILEHGYELRLRSGPGPDLEIRIDDIELLLEVTTPRRMTWKADVFDRLWILAETSDVTFELDTIGEPDPDEVEPQAAVAQCVQSARDLITARQRKAYAAPLVHNIPEIGVALSILEAQSERVTLTTSVPASRRYGTYWYAKEAAKKKRRQFPSGRVNLLLVCPDQMADQDSISFQSYSPKAAAEVPMDWLEVPTELSAILICAFAGGRSSPTAGIWLANPNAAITLPPQVTGFMQTLFPVSFERVEG